MALVALAAFLTLSRVSWIVPQVTKDITYRTVAGTALKMDLYRPEGDAKVPVVVMIHGGAWISGKREDVADLCEWVARSGLAVANIDYRLSPKFRWPAHLEDCQAAVRFLRQNAATYNLSTEKMGTCGVSAGGHLSLLLGMRDTVEKGTTDYPGQSSRVQAVFNIFGPVDVTQDFNPATASMVSLQVIGKDFLKAHDEAVEFSPVTYVKKGVAPVFTLQGLADPLVPPIQASRLSEAYTKVGEQCVTYLVPKLGHTIDMKNLECVEAVKQGIAFLRRHLVEE